MCNPRRILVTATHLLSEAWQREILRVVELQEHVIGEARVRQPLGVTMGGPTLRALEAALAADGSGWVEVDEGYRFEVEGGYVTYLINEQALEIVATLEDVVQATGEATSQLEGHVDMEITAEGEGRYYDDGYGGRTKETAERDAQAAAEQKLAEAAQAQLRQAADQAEAEASEAIEIEARRKAEERLQRQAAERQAHLAEQAMQHLQTVGVRGRHAFHQVMSSAYRDALMAYARQHGADNIHLSEANDVVEIEFSFSG
jgi:hypothetical protein